MKQFGSRWGIKGASELSDGLSAVYRFETRIGEGAQTTDEIYVGLGGGFGTVSLGKQPSAGNVHVGFVDQSLALGSNELLTGDQGSKISYASPSIGGFSFQVDAQGDRSGAQDKDVDSAQLGATLQLGESGKVGVAYVDRATKGMDNPVAKKDPGHYNTSGELCDDPKKDTCTYSAGKAADPNAHLDDDRTAMIAGQYRIGGMALHLGYGQRKWDTDSKAGKWDEDKYAKGLAGGDLLDKKQKTTFFGVGGGIGDTGVSFFLQVKDTKTDSNKVTHSYQDQYDAFVARGYELGADGAITDTAGDPISGTALTAAVAAAKGAGLEPIGNTDTFRPVGSTVTGTTVNAASDPKRTEDRARGSEKSSEKNTPFVLGVSRSLGGGASIHLEHDNTDDDASHNQTALILKVDF